MTKERKEQANILLNEITNNIISQQGRALSKGNIKLYRKLQDTWCLIDEIINVISEAPEDD